MIRLFRPSRLAAEGETDCGQNGCKVEIIHKTVSVYDADGKLLRQESIVDYTKENVRGEYASLDNFIRQWSQEEKKEKIRDYCSSAALIWSR